MRTLLRAFLLLLLSSFTTARLASAADHGDSPSSSNNAAADLGDLYFFLDPGDNNRLVIECTVRGFIVPGEAVNMAIFDPDVIYRFGLEETGDTAPDAFIDVTFSPKSSTGGQIATVRMTRGSTTIFQFSAPATVSTVSPAPPAPVITTTGGVSFFAGETDDPFFFDIPAFGRFVASVRAGSPDPSTFKRGRDTFAGYNIMTIALSFPKSMLNSSNGIVGAEALTFRADQHPLTLFANMSTRGRVAADPDVLIGGLIVTGTQVKRVGLRGIGPSLKSKGVTGALSDPMLTLFDSHGQAIGTNDDWQSTQAQEISASGLAPTDPKESALIVSLAPGLYTAVVSGVNGATGVALVEAYDVDSGAAAANGNLRQIDREGVPAVNALLVPIARKDEYNAASPQEDAAGRFAGDIVATLKSLGTSDANIATLAEVAVNHGDYLRLNLNTANSGVGGGNNSGAGFPNGRRPGDDVVDVLLSIVSNGAITGDNVNSNDVPLRDTFPFLAPPQQPRDPGVIDDNTRN